MRAGKLLPSENAFRTYAALADLLQSGNNGILTAEIAQKAKMTYGAVYYWLKQFRAFGFIAPPRRELRKTSDAKERRQIVIRLSDKPLDGLEKLIDCDGWLMRYLENCNPPLPREWPLPKE